MLVVAAAATLIGMAGGCTRERPTTLAASGTIEITQSDIAAMVAARVTHLLFEEGDSVHAGDTLVRLTQSTLASDIEMRRARIASATAMLRDLEAGARPEEIAGLEASLRAANAEVERTGTELERASAMLKAQAISQAQFDAAKTAAATAASKRDVISESIGLAKAGTREARIRAAKAEVDAAVAGLNAALAANADLVLTAPVSGILLSRHVELGEVIAPGTPAATIGDTQRPWTRVFVAAPALPQLSVGEECLASVDGLPEHLFQCRIVSIDPQAQFTPRIALTKEERADLMFGVKVIINQHQGMLKSGLPIDVHFDTTGTGFPRSLTDGKTIHRVNGNGAG